jgi:hypothetical protein
MNKFENVKMFDLVNSKWDIFIFEFIERVKDGSYVDYDYGKVISYNNSLGNYIGEGISYVDENGELLYNVEIKGCSLIIHSA